MTATHQRTLFSASICVLSCLCLALMGVCSKLVSSNISAFTILLFQCAVFFLITSARALKIGMGILYPTARRGLLCFRSIAALLSWSFLFLALKTTSLVDTMLLNNTAPLWIPLVAFLWLGLRMRKEVWLTVGPGFLGVIAILQPDTGIFRTGSFFALLSGIFMAVSFLAVARLKTTEPTTRILFWYSVLGIIVSLPLGFAVPSPRDFLLLLGVGTFGFGSSWFLAYSFEHGKAATLAPLLYTTVFFSGIFDWLIWEHIPNLLTMIGMALVIGGGVLSLHFERRYQKKLEGKS